MNPTEKALFELRADLARNSEPLDQDKLGGLIEGIKAESDGELRAVCVLLNLNLETMEEKAARLEFDEGIPRVRANRLAVTLALQERDPDISDRAVKWLLETAPVILEVEAGNGWDRTRSLSEWADFTRRCFEAGTVGMVEKLAEAI